MTKKRIALAVALMFSLPAAVVAIEKSDALAETESAESIENLLADASESAAEAAPADATGTAESNAQAEAPAENAGVREARAVTVEAQAQPRVVPVSRAQRAARTAFPRDDEVGAALLPRQIEYFARLEAERGNLVARGDAFPTGSPMNQWLPAQLAYFDRIEEVRMAAAQSREGARAEVAQADAPVAAGERVAVRRALVQ
ncbi:MAG: hypothetical protein IT529_22125 [Burkholderiales bacterium]|nr:hypothetical protein [Burkholderiales bacterium]